MREEDPQVIAGLLHERNIIDVKIAAVTGYPMTAGHLGEWIAASVFEIELENSGTSAALDGHFISGQLQGRTVNVKRYLRRKVFSTSPSLTSSISTWCSRDQPHLRLTRAAVSGPGAWSRLYLSDAQILLAELRERGVKIGVAASVRAGQWSKAEIYAEQRNNALAVRP